MGPSVKKAYNYVTGLLKQKSISPGETLPPVRSLSEAAGVSAPSMLKALSLLKSEGSITGITKSRYRVGNEIYAPLRPSSQLWARIKHDIMRKYISSPISKVLPSINELAQERGVCAATIRKALTALADEGYIVRNKGRFAAVEVTRKTSATSITLISLGMPDGSLAGMNQRMEHFLAFLETECAGININLRIEPFVSLQDTGERTLLHRLKKRVSDIGYILWVGEWIHLGDNYSVVRRLLKSIVKFDNPVAVFDDTNSFELPLQLKNHGKLRLFWVSGFSAGMTLGKTLIEYGHANVLFFSSMHQKHWSQLRYAGIAKAFAEAGLQHALKPLTLNVPYSLGTLALAVSGLSEKELEEMLLRLYSREAVKITVTLILKAREYIAGKPFPQDSPKKIKTVIRRLLEIPGIMDDRTMLEQLYNATVKSAEEILVRSVFNSLFDHAMDDPDASVWVCVNEMAAVEAYKYCRRKGISIPSDISLAGFDDNFEMQRNRITTYSFTPVNIVQKVLSWILRYPVQRANARGEAEEIDGVIIHRDTLARKS